MIRAHIDELISNTDSYNSELNSGEVIHFFGVDGEVDFLRLGRAFGEILQEGSASDDGISRLKVDQARSAGPNGKGFSTEALFPHTDRSGLTSPPRILMNLFVRNAGIGGKAILCPASAIIDHLVENDPGAMDALKATGTVFSRKGQLLQAPILQVLAQGDFLFRFRNDDGIYIPAPMLKAFSGICNAIEKAATLSVFEPGSGYLVNNHKVLHGRTGFIGEREVWRILAN